MSDVPADIDLDDVVTDAQQWEMVRSGGWDGHEYPEKCDDYGEWVAVDDHKRGELLLRKQIWQLMGEVAEARDTLEDPCGHNRHQWSWAHGECIRCGRRLGDPK